MPSLSPTQFESIAARQLTDFDARTPGTAFAEGLQLSVEDAYNLQTAVADLRQQRGEKIIGYKVGCTSPTIRRQLGIDHPITGRLYDTEQHPSGATLSRADFANLAIEGELAVELAREPTDEDLATDGVPPCVARVIPVIELHHLVQRSDQPSAGELIANNAIHAGVVAAQGVSPSEITNYPATHPALTIFIDDRQIDACAGDALTQTIRSSLAWLTPIARERDQPLAAGQIILTGSVPGIVPVHEDCRVRVEAPPLGQVEVQFIP
ncbi:MAG: 2-keto-4-pentenoate hydratase [Planctomycetota bacterium]|jgi:2-keto-4-pentenoate hydratase